MGNIIAVTNQKGGVGKTTSVINIASSLSLLKKKVLVVDLDPQGNATTGSGIEKNDLTLSVYDTLLIHNKIEDGIVRSENCGYDLLPSNRNLSGAEIELVSLPEREYRLKKALSLVRDKYDVILIDCPPSLSLLTLNGLSAAQRFIVPIQCEYYALEGLTDLLNTVSRLKSSINPKLELLGIIRTMYDSRNNLSVAVSNELIKHFGDKVFKTFIPRNVRLAEAPSFGMSVVLLDKNAIGTKAYKLLTKELTKKL
ncbi:MAG: ParA family protein [Neisseriaceae bacterium]